MRKEKTTQSNIKIKKVSATVEEILDLITKGGMVIIVAAVTPLAVQSALPEITLNLVGKVWKKYSQRRLKGSLKRLIEQEMLAFNKKDEKITLTITEKGRKRLLSYNLNKMKLNRPDKWDGKWRVVIFDVVEEKKSLREALRRKMKQLEFVQLQKSVYVTPYPCSDEIAFIREYYLIRGEVSCFMATDLEQEDALNRRFNIIK